MGQWLLLDIGNTHTVAGISENGKLVRQMRYRTDAQHTSDEYRGLLQQFLNSSELKKTERVIVSSVVPQLDRIIPEALNGTSVLFVRADTRRNFDLDIPVPTQLGADRLANIAGAMTLAKAPFLIIDAGTATTFCLLDERPAYIGGAIVPGVEISFKALASRAAKLFSVEMVHPASVLGNTTETQLQSGVLFGYEALMEGMTNSLIQEAQKKYPKTFSQPPTLFATGGCINLLKLSPRFRFEPDLTLIGLIEYGRLTQ